MLDKLIGTQYYVYVDNVFIFKKTAEEHKNNLAEVLMKFNRAGLMLKYSKIVFKVTVIKILTYEIGFNILKPIIN